jgi:hypothetical protein
VKKIVQVLGNLIYEIIFEDLTFARIKQLLPFLNHSDDVIAKLSNGASSILKLDAYNKNRVNHCRFRHVAMSAQAGLQRLEVMVDVALVSRPCFI